MALPATLVWEIRPTNGTANAGGGFDPAVASPGTDYSQQDAVQVAYTDLVIDAVTNTDVTSAATPFTSAHVGNNIAVTGGTGFTTGIYNIRSVTGVIARLDRAVGTTSSTGGTGNLGGARSGFSAGTTTLQASLVAGNTVWVKNEAWNEAVSCTVNGAAATPIVVEGYNASRGDAPLTGATMPTNDRATVAGNACSFNATNYIIKYIRSRRAGSNGFGNMQNGLYYFCISDTNASNGFQLNAGTTLVGCESYGNTGAGVSQNQAARCVGCYVHDNTGAGISNGGLPVALFNIIEANASHGMQGPFDISTATIIGNTINGNTGASTDGINSTAAAMSPVALMLNNIIANNGRYGANGNSAASGAPDYTDYYANATAARNAFAAGAHDLALDPQFTNAAAGDFSIGTNLKAAGWPGAFPGGATSTGYMDLGAVQRQEAGSGGGGGPLIGGRLAL